MFLGKTKKLLLTAFAGLSIALAFPGAAHADRDWHGHHHDNDHVGVIIATPGLAIGLGDTAFAGNWNRADYHARSSFCHDVRRDCYYEGRWSRACHLKWQYCSPEGRDYGYYFNH